MYGTTACSRRLFFECSNNGVVRQIRSQPMAEREQVTTDTAATLTLGLGLLGSGPDRHRGRDFHRRRWALAAFCTRKLVQRPDERLCLGGSRHETNDGRDEEPNQRHAEHARHEPDAQHADAFPLAIRSRTHGEQDVSCSASRRWRSVSSSMHWRQAIPPDYYRMAGYWKGMIVMGRYSASVSL